jgi:hypothetical protein
MVLKISTECESEMLYPEIAVKCRAGAQQWMTIGVFSALWSDFNMSERR